MNDPDQCSGGDQPGGIQLETQEQEEADQHDEDGEGILDGGGGKLNSDSQHQSQGGHVDPVQEGGRPGGVADAGNQQTGGGDKDERRKKDAHGGKDRSWNTPEQVTDKGGGGENGPRGDLADGDGIDQLSVGEPAQPLDEVCPQVCQQHVTAAVERGTDL